ncbi:GNAT family protein [Hahella aquimaris]|uniref:GNAT family N-acetyltransferase n=1 Tax=Hahella sp. HNIBRBA332 TaxID=3015983 RepID=UPI00273CB3F4|nr:GNAT family protein [Hahella sp. HNIBRBA332]WLQ16500.1 GNAT family protein [Hahella sp. HNIBRBA332]
MRVERAKSSKRTRRPTPKPKVVKPRLDIPKVEASDVTLVPLSGTPGKGKGPGGEKWRIEFCGVRAGEVYINVIDEPPIGLHASIQIYLNKKSQGRGIGRIGYYYACLKSQHDVIYAHMRKSNIASRRAAEAAGFFDASPPGYSQLIMKRVRTCTGAKD